MTKPVFLDPSGRRGRWTGRSLIALLLVAVAAAAVLALTIVDVPIPGPLPLRMEQARLPGLAERIGAAGRRAVHAIGRAWLPRAPARGGAGSQLVAGFYVPWDEGSRASLAAHVSELDWVMPATAFVTGPDHRLEIAADPRFDAILAGARRRPLVLPVVQNAHEGQWDGAGLAALLRDPRARTRLLGALEAMVAARRAAGIVFDFEELPPAAQRDYLRFLGEAHRRFGLRGWMVAAAAPVGDADWNLHAYAEVTDKLFLMLYDQHWASGDAGPIAAQGWFVRNLQRAVREVGAGKAIATIANYAYDWAPGRPAEALTVEEAWLAARDSAAPIRFDPASGNSAFAYEEEGENHQVWMLDAASGWNQLRAAHLEGVSGVALWRLGSEDPGLWRAFAGFAAPAVPDLSTIRTISNIDVEGAGEILRIESTPSEGRRRVAADASGLIRDERYLTLPSPYLVRRTGYRPGEVALTFDDGPDPEWTPAILDILRDRHVPAAFFIVGENALPHPGLLARIVAEGHELGNHSYTHPNFAVGSPGTELEFAL